MLQLVAGVDLSLRNCENATDVETETKFREEELTEMFPHVFTV